jgi:hypothetical protein
MMQCPGPFEQFSPIHLAWLYRRHELRLDVTAADLDSIEAEQPEAINDPLFSDYRSRADAGNLYRRRGRKPLSVAGNVRLWAARFAIEDEKERLWEARKTGRRQRRRSDESPIHEAANIVAREFRLGSGRSLLNRLSREGISDNF